MTRKQMKRRIEELNEEHIRLGNELRAEYDKVWGLNQNILAISKEASSLQRELDFEKLRTEFLTEKVRELLRRSTCHEDLSDGALD